MRVIIEGPDGAGKSTLVNYLIKNYNLEMIHSSSDTKNDLEYHLELISKDDRVLDRANLGEIVYPVLYNREAKMSWDEQIDFMNKCMEEKVIYIIFYSSDFEVLKKRLFGRGDMQKVLDNAKTINCLFRLLAEQFGTFYPNVHTIDISKVNDQIAWFEEVLHEDNTGK